MATVTVMGNDLTNIPKQADAEDGFWSLTPVSEVQGYNREPDGKEGGK